MAELPQPAHIREEARKQAHKDAAAERRHQKVRDARAKIKVRRETRLAKQAKALEAKRKPILEAEDARQVEDEQVPTSSELNVEMPDATEQDFDEMKEGELEQESSVVLDPEFASTLTETSAGVYEEMQPESKSIIESVYEKVQSTEIVQNLSDRFKAWKNKKLSLRTEAKIADLKDALNEHIQSMEGTTANLEKEITQLETSKEALEKIGQEMGEESLRSINERVTQLQESVADTQGSIDSLNAQVEDQESRLNVFNEGVERAKDSLVGRLEEKIDSNNIEVASAFEKNEALIKLNKEMTDEVRKVDSSLEIIDGILAEKPSKALAEELKKQKKEALKVKANLQSQINANNSDKKTNAERVKILEIANLNLNNEKNAIIPPIEMDASDVIEETELAEDKPLKHSIDARLGIISIEDGDDVIVISGEGSTKNGLLTTPTENLDAELLQQLPLDALQDYNVPQTTIDAIMRSIARADARATESASEEETPASTDAPEESTTDSSTAPQSSEKVIVDPELEEEARQVDSQEESEDNEVRPTNLVDTWNKSLSSVDRAAGMEISMEDFAIPTQEINSASEALKILRGILVKKAGIRAARDLSPQSKKQIDGFIKNTTLFKKAA